MEGFSERMILSQEKAVVTLKPKRGLVGMFLRGFSVFFGGVVLRSLQTRSFLRSVGREGEVEAGDIKDVTDKQVKLRELTLTNQNILMLYRKGRIRKRDHLIVLPLRYAKSVAERGRIGKTIWVGFEIPREGEKPIFFDLILRVKNREHWIEALNSLVAPKPSVQFIYCPNCGRQISSTFSNCPHCNAALPKPL